MPPKRPKKPRAKEKKVKYSEVKSTYKCNCNQNISVPPTTQPPQICQRPVCSIPPTTPPNVIPSSP